MVAALAAVLLPGCSEKDIEATLGKQAAAAIAASYKLVDDPLVTSYVNTMGHILVGHSKRQDIPYEFRIIDTEVVNAAAAPYGHIYLTTGLLDFVQTEDELWAVTGHEVGHEVAQDSMKQVKESFLLSLASLIIGRESRVGGQIADMGFDLISLKHSRDDEYRADDHGTQVTLAAGYDPKAEMAFFERLMKEVEKDHPSRLDTFFMTHPPTKDRIRRQSERPDGALTDPDLLVEVAAGYARRSRHADAIVRLKQALEQKPDMVSARLRLADSYLARGDSPQAAAEYSLVLKADPALTAAQDGLRAAQAASAPRVAAASGEEVAAAVASLERAAKDVEAAHGQVTAVTAAFPKQLKPTATAIKTSTDTLVGLAQSGVQLPQSATETAIQAAAAVGETNESVCTLELIAETTQETTARLSRALRAAQPAATGAVSAEDAAALQRSAREAQQAAQELTDLCGDLPALVKGVQSAGRVAQTAVDRLARALRPGSALTDRQIAADSVKLSRQRGGKAREEARKAAARAVLAKTRALVAEINVAAVTLGPARRQAGEGLVAYYTQSDPETVRSFREADHLGLGEVALLLGAAASSQRPPESILGAAGAGLALTDAAKSSSAQLQYVNLFLKFIADGIAKEASL
jgi:predicted Zn-dependent protease